MLCNPTWSLQFMDVEMLSLGHEAPRTPPELLAADTGNPVLQMVSPLQPACTRDCTSP